MQSQPDSNQLINRSWIRELTNWNEVRAAIAAGGTVWWPGGFLIHGYYIKDGKERFLAIDRYGHACVVLTDGRIGYIEKQEEQQ